MRSFHITRLATAVGLALGLTVGFGPGAMAAGTVKVGMSAAFTGPVASIGIAAKRGAELALAKVNDDGGLLGKKITLVTADSALSPATGATNVRNFALSDHVKAIIGPTASSVGASEVLVAAKYHLPIFLWGSNDVDMTGKYFSKYVFQIVPSTYMEPHAVAAYVAKLAKKHHWKTYATISPNYSFGHDTVKQFLDGMHKYGASVDIVSQQWPALGASDFTQYISATMSKKPNFVFVGEYGGDLVTLTKQAKGYGLFKSSHVYGLYLLSVLKTLGAEAPVGAVAADRAHPFYLHPTSEMQQFTKAYHQKYNEWPSTWAVLGYTSAETWVDGVKKAGSFDADKVSKALSGATVNTVNGTFKLRACDHLAEVSEYVGVLSKKVNPKYGIRTMTNVYAASPHKIMMTCKAKQAMRGS